MLIELTVEYDWWCSENMIHEIGFYMVDFEVVDWVRHIDCPGEWESINIDKVRDRHGSEVSYLGLPDSLKQTIGDEIVSHLENLDSK